MRPGGQTDQHYCEDNSVSAFLSINRLERWKDYAERLFGQTAITPLLLTEDTFETSTNTPAKWAFEYFQMVKKRYFYQALVRNESVSNRNNVLALKEIAFPLRKDHLVKFAPFKREALFLLSFLVMF